MRKYYSFGLAVVFLLTVACSHVTKDIKVSAGADPKANFSGYKTYTWSGSARLLYDPEGKWEPREIDLDAEVRWLIDQELRNRNMTQTTESPDMIVGFTAGIDMAALEVVENTKTKTPMLENIPKGALAVVFADATTRQIIWLGTAVGNIQEQPSNEVVRKRLAYAVKEMFKLLPR